MSHNLVDPFVDHPKKTQSTPPTARTQSTHSTPSSGASVKRQTAAPARLHVRKIMQPQTPVPAPRAKFSFGKQLDAPEMPTKAVEGLSTPSSSTTETATTESEDEDWLAAMEKRLVEDLDASKKELGLIKMIQEELHTKLHKLQNNQRVMTDTSTIITASSSNIVSNKASVYSRKLRDQKALMGACREYSESRIQILKDRLRQVQFWLGSRPMGRKVPTRAPEEWLIADKDWRQWLSEQTVATRAQLPIEAVEDTAWRVFGPLPYIFAAYEWLDMDPTVTVSLR